ncbi:iron ABC transporter permease [candidate division KSB1 bacterium]|nr:iron ABC transporter permease [candidate division KSB1 bacterium]
MTVARLSIRTWKDILFQLRIEFKFGFNGWTIFSLFLVLLICIPIFIIFSHLFASPSSTWSHLASTVLKDYIINSFILIAGVGSLSLIMGVSTAWLVTTCNFPGRKFFSWALILPLSIPTYIAAYTYAGIFDYTGPVQKWVTFLGIDNNTIFFDVMTIEAIIFILAFTLFPYVYLITRTSFHRQSRTFLESSRSLGKGQFSTFFKIALPLARPAIVGGLFLVLMEVLNDYGAVKYFGIPTFTTGIFRAWFSLGDSDAAIRLSAILMIFIFSLMWLENWQRGKAKFTSSDSSFKPMQKLTFGKVGKSIAFTICLVPFLFGFFIPVLQLGSWALQTAKDVVNTEFIVLVLNSFFLAVVAALLCVFVALVLIYTARLYHSYLTSRFSQIAVLGYSMPGAVIAVGVLIPLISLDKSIAGFMSANFGISTGLLLTGTIFALIFAYLVRFLAISFNPIKAGFENTCEKLDEASRSLGISPLRTLRRINLPLIKGTLLGAAILVFVDVLKELPIILVLRPFNFNTLSIRAFELASDEMVAQSANAAIIIILTGIIPIIILSNLISREAK